MTVNIRVHGKAIQYASEFSVTYLPDLVPECYALGYHIHILSANFITFKITHTYTWTLQKGPYTRIRTLLVFLMFSNSYQHWCFVRVLYYFLQHIVSVEVLKTHISFVQAERERIVHIKITKYLRYVMKEVYLRFNCVNVKLIYANFCRPTFSNQAWVIRNTSHVAL